MITITKWCFAADSPVRTWWSRRGYCRVMSRELRVCCYIRWDVVMSWLIGTDSVSGSVTAADAADWRRFSLPHPRSIHLVRSLATPRGWAGWSTPKSVDGLTADQATHLLRSYDICRIWKNRIWKSGAVFRALALASYKPSELYSTLSASAVSDVGGRVEGRPSEIALSRDRRALRTIPDGCSAVSISGSMVDASRCAADRSSSPRRRLNCRRWMRDRATR